jgi:Gpi18-like mannosyltransferase
MKDLTEPAVQPDNAASQGLPGPTTRIAAGIRNYVTANREAFRIWLSWRLVIFILPVFAAAFIPLAATANKAVFNNPWDPWLNRLIWNWSQSDSEWYLRIAAQGYINDQTVAFYPLYPLLMRWTGFVLWLGQPGTEAYRLAGVLIASLAALVFCIYFIRLMLLDYSLELSRLGLLYFAAFPTAFYLFAVYTESLFLALSVTAFYAARQNRWLAAMALAALAVLTRQQGLLVVLALLFEYGQQIDWKWKKLNRQLLLFGFPALALGGWLAWNWLTFGNPLAPVAATQKYWERYLAWPWWSYLLEWAGLFYREPGSTTWQPINQFENPAGAMPLLNAATTTLFIILACIGYRAMRRDRFRAAYFVLITGCLLQPLISPVVGDPLESMPRYLLLSFPSFILLARLGQRWPLFNYTYLGLSLALLGLLVARFTLGYWVA